MSFFKSNTTSTNATENTANQETGNNNGGLLKGLAIGIGTVAGIGLAAFGGTKAYKHFHVKDENRLDDVTDNDDDFDEFFEDDEENVEEETSNNETVESFNEVETEESVEAEEAKTEETNNEASVEAEEAKAEETENPHAMTEVLVNHLTEEASKCASIKTASSLISSIKKMDEMVGFVASMYRTIGDNAKIDSAITELYKAFNSYWNNLDVKISNCDKETFVACASEIDAVNNAWWDMQYIQMNRIATETMGYVVNKYAHMERVAKRKEEKAALAAETQAAQKSSDETQAEVKKVVDETQATTKTSGETKTEVKMSIREEVAREKLEEKMNILKRLQTADYADAGKMLMLAISMVDYSIGTLRALKVSDISEIETIANRNASLALDKYLSKRVKDINSVTVETHKILITITAELMTVKGVCDKCEELHIFSKTRVRLEKTLELSKKRDKHLFQKKVEEAMKTRVVDETQATTEEVPTETQIGNATVISDDGETVTLKASVSEDSVQNVMDVIDIVSKIPNRKDPEKNDMPYFIRVIGGRIAGITEPEATFLAYNDKTKSNDFIDACVTLCNMVGTGICNLADQKSNPIGSLGWINRSYDELIASGVIDNTYNPQAMRDVLTKARDEATRVLTNMVKKSSDETQADDKSSGETKTEETLTYTMSEKIQEAVQQSDETAATTEPESNNQAPMSPEASSLAAKLQEVGELMRAEKWSDASEFYKTQLTPYLADDGLSKELRDEIMGIKTKATNMLMSQKQLEAKQKAASAKASKKNSKKRRRH